MVSQTRDREALEQAIARGSELLKQSKLDQAQRAFRAALELDPDNLRVCALLGLAHFRAGQFAEARPIYELLVERAPTDASHRLNLGLVYLKLSDAERAITALEASRALDPSQGRAVSYLGLAYARAGRYAEAYRSFLLAGQNELALEIVNNLSAADRDGIHAQLGRTPTGPLPVAAAASGPAASEPAKGAAPAGEPAAAAGATPSVTRAPTPPGTSRTITPHVIPRTPTPVAGVAAIPRTPAEPRTKPPAAPPKRTRSQEVAVEPSMPEPAAAGAAGAERQSATPQSATPQSATPQSATPQSATPQSATPQSATPQSATPHSATPQSATPHSATPHSATPHSATPQSATPQTADPQSADPQSAVRQSATPPQSAAPQAAAVPAGRDREVVRLTESQQFVNPMRSMMHMPPAMLEGHSMLSMAVAAAEPSPVAVPRAPAGGLPPRPLSELATDDLIRPDDGAEPFEIARSGAMVIRVIDRVLTRLDGVCATGGDLSYERAMRRSRGHQTDEPFDDGGPPLHVVHGNGYLIAAPDARTFTAVILDDDILYLREELVFAFQATLRWENGNVPGLRGKLHVVQFRGDGALAMRLARPLVRVKLPAQGLLFVDADRLAGWIGRVIPRAVVPPSGGPLGAMCIECTGEGIVLIEAAPASGPGGATAGAGAASEAAAAVEPAHAAEPTVPMAPAAPPGMEDDIPPELAGLDRDEI